MANLSPREIRQRNFQTLYDLETRQALMTYSASGYDGWQMVKERIRDAFDCSEDDVHCIETEEGDRITARGIPVAYIGAENAPGAVA